MSSDMEDETTSHHDNEIEKSLSSLIVPIGRAGPSSPMTDGTVNGMIR